MELSLKELPAEGSPLYYHALKSIASAFLKLFQKEIKVMKHNERIRKSEANEIDMLKSHFHDIQDLFDEIHRNKDTLSVRFLEEILSKDLQSMTKKLEYSKK